LKILHYPKSGYPSEFDERWLERRINETMEAFRKKKDGISCGDKSGAT
jgi:hypothetical protein